MIRRRESVIQAIAECDRLGRMEFLKQYGYRKARDYVLIHDGKHYDSKAIVGVAYGFENPDVGPLTAGGFSGGDSTVRSWLEELGFVVTTRQVTTATRRAFILTWNPTRWEWDDFDDMLSDNQHGSVIAKPWSTGNNRSIQAGERVFLYRQSTGQGLIASGYTASDVYLDSHWDGSGREAGYVRVDFETILPEADVLPVDRLVEHEFGVQWRRMQASEASGISVPEQSVASLEQVWEQHLSDLDRLHDPISEEVPAPSRFVEGATRIVTVNAFERSAAARQECVARWGVNCSVCGFNFGQVFGDLGEGFIHVHHLQDLATIGEEYEVDPEEDLRPVCPNCHAMLHRTTPAISIEELRQTIEQVESRVE